MNKLVATQSREGSVVVHVERLRRDPPQQLSGEDPKQRPRQIQRLEHRPPLVALVDELALKLVEKLQVEQILAAQRLLADDSLHRQRILPYGVVGVQLIAHLAVVPARHALPDGRLHQPRERRQHVDWRGNLPVVQLPVHVNLPLRDVPRQVGNRVRDVVVGHGQYGQLGDGPFPPLDPSRALVDGGEIRVHVAWVAPAPRHLLPRRGNLSQRVGVRAHVRQDDQHVLAALVRQVLRRGERDARGDDALDRRIVREVEEEDNLLERPVALEISSEKIRRLEVHAHRREDDAKLVIPLVELDQVVRGVRLLHQAGLSADLRGDFVVG
mmetsp:Transcript_12476/g.56228  ORF Transcript_12476/g.56228 Transcript_12476/m.56228 type:complete len:326 (+) Transcript_12476:60-1037(+)